MKAGIPMNDGDGFLLPSAHDMGTAIAAFFVMLVVLLLIALFSKLGGGKR